MATESEWPKVIQRASVTKSGLESASCYIYLLTAYIISNGEVYVGLKMLSFGTAR